MSEIEKKEIPIDWEGEKKNVVIRKFTFGIENEIRRQSTKLKYVGTVPHASVDVGAFMEFALLKSIMKAPFKFSSIEDIRNLPARLGKKIYDEIEKFNNLSELKKES